MSMQSAPRISVIIPTYHRPAMLRTVVASVLAQELDWGDFEVVVAVSDAASEEDLSTAHELSATDSRVVVTVAAQLGPAAARNVGMAAARGAHFAFIDDDCEARPGWLRAGVDKLGDVDIVQGRTLPAEPVESKPHGYSIRVEKLSWLWETCNLFVRRVAAERAGGFNEDWNPLKQPGRHWGEDTEWGWRLVRAGATYAFEPAAAVEHAVFARTFTENLEYRLRARYMGLFIREMPEVRRWAYRGYFISRPQLRITAAAVCFGGAGAARLVGARRAARRLTTLGLVPLLTPVRGHVWYTFEEVLVFLAAVYGSVKYRRLIL